MAEAEASRPAARGGLPVSIVGVPAFCLFHSYLRLQVLVRLDDAPADEQDAALVFPRLIVGQLWVERRAACRFLPERQAVEVTIEALVDRALFPAQAALEIACRGRMASLPALMLMQHAARGQARSLDGAFRAIIRAMRRAGAGARPRMLDIGGRARSGVDRRADYPQCRVTVFDIVADPGVDVVGDAHELSRHFPPASFDCALCVSVFEHLLMPWKAALEINAVLRPGGVALLHTHQTIGMHDMPWDFWRYSDTSWHGLFNARTGFEVMQTSMQDFMQVVPLAWTPRHREAERSGGFEGSSVIVRKTGEAALRWDVKLTEILDTAYPAVAPPTDAG